MHPFSILTLGIFVAGYTTARWDLIHQLYELTIFAWDHGVFVSGDTCQLQIRVTNRFQDTSCQGFRGSISLIFCAEHTRGTHCCTRKPTRRFLFSNHEHTLLWVFADQNIDLSIQGNLKAEFQPESNWSAVARFNSGFNMLLCSVMPA